MAKHDLGPFKFRKTDSIGAAGAEQDKFLSKCFVDTGDLAVLEDVESNRRIVLGRTGSGKSALLAKLLDKHGDAVISIVPDNLALTYVSNSTILRFFSDLGVNLDPFFKLLWRHVFTVEILNRHFEKSGSTKEPSLLDLLRRHFLGDTKKHREMNQAIKYLQDWGESFWEETEFRIKEVTKKLEDSLNAELAAGMGVPGSKVTSTLRGASKLSEEQKTELVQRGQRIVAQAQIQDLHRVIDLLDTVLENRQKKYFVIIDGLDQNWVEERLRYRLIMALIETVQEFIRVRNAKIIIALRRDLIDRVFRLTRQAGFQEEKYQSLYLPLVWSKDQLVKVLDKRIQELVSRRYVRQLVDHQDMLPRRFRKVQVTDYVCGIVSRPRDVISFFNCCIGAATNLSKLSARELSEAEGEYSRSRYRALGDEWSQDYPSLLDFAKILQRRSSPFKVGAIPETEVEELCLDVVANDPGGDCLLKQQAKKVVDCVTSPTDFKHFLIQVFHHVGLVGLKLASFEAVSWMEYGKTISPAEVGPDTRITVHPAYHRVLGIVQ